MKQWISDLSGLAGLRQITTAETPEPGEDEVLVEIHAVSLNFRDIEGKYTTLYTPYTLPTIDLLRPVAY
jgi:NADPH:quinone reductase-like Zn-dependent oxidoreductase